MRLVKPEVWPFVVLSAAAAFLDSGETCQVIGKYTMQRDSAAPGGMTVWSEEEQWGVRR